MADAAFRLKAMRSHACSACSRADPTRAWSPPAKVKAACNLLEVRRCIRNSAVTCLRTGVVSASQVMLAMFIAMLNFVVPQLTDSLEVGTLNAECNPPPAN